MLAGAARLTGRSLSPREVGLWRPCAARSAGWPLLDGHSSGPRAFGRQRQLLRAPAARRDHRQTAVSEDVVPPTACKPVTCPPAAAAKR
jgi:hypothetical protein